jgi:hypothetical protein
MDKTLLECFDDAKSDKGTRKHYYNDQYEPHFEPLRYEEFNFLEIGILKGASVDAHLDYFPNAKIYAIDTFERKPPTQIRTCNEPDPRFKWLKADSSDPHLTAKMQEAWGDIKFDIILDDGAHWFDMMRLTFEQCYPMMSEKGKYFIEDMWPLGWMTEENCAKMWQLTDFPHKFGRHMFDDMIKSFEHMKTTHYDCRVKPRGHRIGKTNASMNGGKAWLENGEWIGDSTIMMLENK